METFVGKENGVLVGNGFNHAILDMEAGVGMIKDIVLLFTRYFDTFQIDLPFSVFVLNLPLPTFRVAIPPVAVAVRNNFPVDVFVQVPAHT